MRAAQAANADEPTELTAFKFLEQKGCDVIPRLLGYHHDQQDRDDTVPGGFITYVIWAKVAGDSLDWEAFWSSSFSQRQEIRLQFDEVYEKVKACAYNSGTGMRKIIYDWPTKTMHLSGLSDWTPAAEGTKWPDSIYVNYGLVQPPTAKDHFFSIHSEDLQYDDKGWNW